MPKASAARIAKKTGARRSMSPEEILQLKLMSDLVSQRKFEAAQVAGNTALVPRGQDVAKELEALARLLENAKNIWVSQTLVACGYPQGVKCNINLATGAIELVTE